MAFLLLTLAVAPPAQAQQSDTASAAAATAQAAAESWLKLVDHLRYGESWDSAAGFFRRAIGKADWEQTVLQVRGPLEPFAARKLLNARHTTALPNAPPGEYVILQFETRVKGGRAVIETVIPVKEPDGIWRAAGYFVRPQ